MARTVSWPAMPAVVRDVSRDAYASRVTAMNVPIAPAAPPAAAVRAPTPDPAVPAIKSVATTPATPLMLTLPNPPMTTGTWMPGGYCDELTHPGPRLDTGGRTVATYVPVVPLNVGDTVYEVLAVTAVIV